MFALKEALAFVKQHASHVIKNTRRRNDSKVANKFSRFKI